MDGKVNVDVQLGETFWLLVLLLIAGLVLWRVLGSERLAGVIREGWRDATGSG